MKLAFVLVVGLVASGCDMLFCPPQDPEPVRVGSYTDSTSGDSEHLLVVSPDRQTVIETFVRDGKRYEIRYRVTAEPGPR
jgi:hypothetical protein